MAKYQVDFSGARNIIDPLEGVRNSLQQTNATLGQMIGQDEQRAERLRDEAYRRDALALQQAAAQRDADKYNQELADRAFAQKTFAAYNQTPTRDYSALPSQLTDTDRGKAVINDMALTPEELALIYPPIERANFVVRKSWYGRNQTITFVNNKNQRVTYKHDEVLDVMLPRLAIMPCWIKREYWSQSTDMPSNVRHLATIEQLTVEVPVK